MNHADPSITVLMPVYNAAPFVSGAIRSILSQTQSDFELLIINDGSTDGSLDVIRQFHDPRIRIISNERNERLSAVLNKGIELAHGQYIARMDADDISLPSRLEEQLTFMREHPDIALCGTMCKDFGDSQKKPQHQPVTQSEIQCCALVSSPFIHPSVMFRKSVFLRRGLRFEEEYSPAEDYHCWVRLIQQEQAANIPKVLLLYRVHQMSMSQSPQYQGEDKSKIAAKKIHRRQLGLLGVDPTDRESEIHYMIGNQIFEGETDFLREVRRWLEKLFTVNERRHVYDEHALSVLFSRRWFRACTAMTFLGWETARMYREAPPFLLRDIPLHLRMILALKCLVTLKKTP